MTDLSKDYIFDIEVYPNTFTLTLMSAKTRGKRLYEISPRRNDLWSILLLVKRLQESQARMVGFNNLGYDYPVIHHLLTRLSDSDDQGYINRSLYAKSMSIIEAPHEDRFAHVIWDSEQLVKQVDLYKIHHFDNPARATSLKVLEFNMRMDDIRELPFPVGTHLTNDQIDVLLEYNTHDVEATYQFYLKSLPAIEFREALSEKYDRNFINHNDTKIGKDYFVMRLESKLGKKACFSREDGVRKPNQTRRKQIALKDVIFDYIDFKTPQFQAIKAWIEKRVIKQTKAVFTELPKESLGELEQYADLKMTKGRVKTLNCILDGLQFVFGTGGIHASVDNQCISADEDHVILDLDVTSYYPSLAIVNRIYPEHLGEAFCDIYADMKTQRVRYSKGTPENAMLKLALNGVYGDSNNKFSPFYDPQYTMSITINGQLLLCLLYEDLREIEGLELIQMNTDGLTVKVPRDRIQDVYEIRSMWELLTGLELEEARYTRMFVRDVNNYIAEYEKGGVKRKGAYEYKLDWHQNFSALIIPKAAEAHLIEGVDLKEFVVSHADDYDFLLRTKVPRSSRLVGDWGAGVEEELQNVTRYFIANDGPELVKIMPPLPKAPDKERRIGVNKGCMVRVCNQLIPIDRSQVNYDWYVAEASKLVQFKRK